MAAFVLQVRQNPKVLFENVEDRKFALFCIRQGYSKGSITRLLEFLHNVNVGRLTFTNGDQVYKPLSMVPVTVRIFFLSVRKNDFFLQRSSSISTAVDMCRSQGTIPAMAQGNSLLSQECESSF